MHIDSKKHIHALTGMRFFAAFLVLLMHFSDHCNLNHYLASVGQIFEVFTKSSVTFKPSKRSFDNPSFGNNGKFTGMV